MTTLEKPIGVFDSGIGGLTVLKELKKRLPNERFIYLGDTARTPYGTKGPETIKRYALECRDFLLRRDIKLLVAACNTVCSIALKDIETDCPVPVVGTIKPAVKAFSELELHNRIGVIGTQATINSNSYEIRLKEALGNIDIFSSACPLFVPLVEQGMYQGEIVDKIVELYLKDLREKKLDALILGCTHYPMLTGAISKFMGPEVKIIECSKAVATVVEKELLDSTPDRRSPDQLGGVAANCDSVLTPRCDQYYVTDDVPRFDSIADLILPDRGVTAIEINSLSSK